MAYINGWMTSEDGSKVYCTCEHHKVFVPNKKDHLEVHVPWDDQFRDGDLKQSKL